MLSGTARGVVVNTGDAHLFRRHLASGWPAQREQTSFDQGVERFTWLMIRFMVVMVSRRLPDRRPHQGQLARGPAVRPLRRRRPDPEMLPMIVTVNLSKGALTMSRKKVIVKQLHAIQNFGAMDILCTDKTGTLTQDQVVLERHVDVTNRHERGRAALRVHEQLLPDRPAQPARPRRSSPTPTSTWSATAARSTRSPSISSAGACRW